MNNKIAATQKIISKENLLDLYINQNLNKATTARYLGITIWGLNNLLITYNIRKNKKDILETRKQTCMKKYNCEYSSSSEKVKNKILQTNISKYGANSFTASDPGKAVIKQTKMLRYGSDKYNNIEKNKQTKLQRYDNEYYNNRDKYKETMLTKYDVDNSFKLQKIRLNHVKEIATNLGYTNNFYLLLTDKKASIDYLKDKHLSYHDLAQIFNAPYYTIQQWVTKFELKDYINFSFTGRSSYEDAIIAYLNSLNILDIEKNAKVLPNNQEIDIFLPDYNLGIEVNGAYWHSSLFKSRNYHLDKSKVAEAQGIHLIHIYDYEWQDPDMQRKIKNILKVAVQKIDNRIFARNCTLREVTNKEAKIFNDNNHIQNHRNAAITYGLFYYNTLVQLMSFSHNKKYEWEIIRSCSAENAVIIGGVSKLFKYFIKKHLPKQIFSYCDFNKFNGHGYEQLGMKFVGYTGPDMKYIIRGTVVNRQPSKYKQLKDQVDAELHGAGSKKYLWEINS